jgi:hypothetical protein
VIRNHRWRSTTRSTAMPGKTVTIPVLQNDLIARGDVVSLSMTPSADAASWKIDTRRG